MVKYKDLWTLQCKLYIQWCIINPFKRLKFIHSCNLPNNPNGARSVVKL